MSSPNSSARVRLASHFGVALALFVVSHACGEPPVYQRVGLDDKDAGTDGANTDTGGVKGTGGRALTGGTSTGGSSTTGGSSATGGRATGGAIATGGVATGGAVATGGGVATGGVATGGVATGGAKATGGVSTGGAATGGASTGGAGTGGATTFPSAIDCSAPSTPAGGLLSDFNGTAPLASRWASSNGLSGAIFAYHGGTSSTSTATVGSSPQDFHFTSSVVTGSYSGCGIVFDKCQAFGTYNNIRFSVSGTSNCRLELQIQTYNQRPTTDNPAGGCTGSSCVKYATAANLSFASSPVTVPLSALSGWSSSLASQVVGVQWQLTNPTGTTCTGDLHFDDVTLLP